MNGEHVNETDCKRLGGSDPNPYAGQPGKVPFPSVVKGIRFHIEDRVNRFRVRPRRITVAKNNFPSSTSV